MTKNILRFVFGFVVLVLISGNCLAQDADTTYWKKKFSVGANINQASFSDNWIGGGVNSLGFNTFLLFKGNYAKGVHSWDNLIDLSYGILKNEGQSARKATDYMLLDTKYGRKLSSKWNFFTSLTFLSQFTAGYQYDVERPDGSVYDSLVSKFMSPAYLTSAWGLEYKPADYFSLRLSPFAPKFTFVMDDAIAMKEVEGPYGLDAGKNVRAEWLAFQAFADFNKKLSENLNLSWKYVLFINYENISPKDWDHRLDVMLKAQVHKYVSVNLGGILLYDRDQDEDVQLNQFLNIGLVYTIQNYEEKK